MEAHSSLRHPPTCTTELSEHVPSDFPLVTPGTATSSDDKQGGKTFDVLEG